MAQVGHGRGPPRGSDAQPRVAPGRSQRLAAARLQLRQVGVGVDPDRAVLDILVVVQSQVVVDDVLEGVQLGLGSRRFLLHLASLFLELFVQFAAQLLPFGVDLRPNESRSIC